MSGRRTRGCTRRSTSRACRSTAARRRKKGKSKELDEAAIVKWIVAWGKSQHGLDVASDAAQHLLDLTGPVFGLLDQNLAKLGAAGSAGQQRRRPSRCRRSSAAGGARGFGSWSMRPPAARRREALTQLDRLLHAGEHPLALVGSLSWSLRRYAAATRIFQQAERAGRKIPLREALTQAGVRDWPIGSLAAAEKRLHPAGPPAGRAALSLAAGAGSGAQGEPFAGRPRAVGAGAARAADGEAIRCEAREGCGSTGGPSRLATHTYAITGEGGTSESHDSMFSGAITRLRQTSHGRKSIIGARRRNFAWRISDCPGTRSKALGASEGNRCEGSRIRELLQTNAGNRVNALAMSKFKGQSRGQAI